MLSPTGDAGSAFHTQNDPSNPYQRTNIIERKGAVDVRCSCLDIIHGLFDSDGTAFSTLLVLEFRFDVRKRARRIASVDITLEFDSIQPDAPAPEVYSIAPVGRLSLVQTTQQEHKKKSAGIKLDVGAVLGLDVGGSLQWEKGIDRDTMDATTVIGSIDLLGRNWGKPNCASWTLLENKTTKTGVPQSMRVALLLKRKDENSFQCMATIKAKADTRSSLESLFGAKPKDDPVLFDSTMKPTNNLQQYEVDNLSATSLESISDIAFTTVFSAAIKEKQAGDFTRPAKLF